MQVQITNSIASADWSYGAGQIVKVGSEFSATEIPADIAPAWLESGIASRCEEKASLETDAETAALKRKKK